MKWTPPWAESSPLGLFEVPVRIPKIVLWSWDRQQVTSAFVRVSEIAADHGARATATRRTINVGPALRERFEWPADTVGGKSSQTTVTFDAPLSSQAIDRMLQLANSHLRVLVE